MTPLTAATQVIVHFIGLFTMFAPGADHVVHAVLPPIPAALGVGPHTAAIVYPTGSDTYSAGWTNGPQPFKASNSWSYLELEDGDRVSFLMPPSSNLPAVPAEIPHLKNCARFQDLQDGFKPPAFASARAVVDIPYGTLTAIKQWAPNAADGRADTELAFDDNGPVVVTVTTKTSATRILILQPGTCLALMHEPTPLFTGVGQVPHDVMHTAAFQAMAVTPSPHALNCSETNSPADAAVVNPPKAPTSTIVTEAHHSGADGALAPATPVARPSTQASPTLRASCPDFPMTVRHGKTMNSDCSNSQWP